MAVDSGKLSLPEFLSLVPSSHVPVSQLFAVFQLHGIQYLPLVLVGTCTHVRTYRFSTGTWLNFQPPDEMVILFVFIIMEMYMVAVKKVNYTAYTRRRCLVVGWCFFLKLKIFLSISVPGSSPTLYLPNFVLLHSLF